MSLHNVLALYAAHKIDERKAQRYLELLGIMNAEAATYLRLVRG